MVSSCFIIITCSSWPQTGAPIRDQFRDLLLLTTAHSSWASSIPGSWGTRSSTLTLKVLGPSLTLPLWIDWDRSPLDLLFSAGKVCQHDKNHFLFIMRCDVPELVENQERPNVNTVVVWALQGYFVWHMPHIQRSAARNESASKGQSWSILQSRSGMQQEHSASHATNTCQGMIEAVWSPKQLL